MTPTCEVCTLAPSTRQIVVAKQWTNVCTDCGDDQGVVFRESVGHFAALTAEPSRWHSQAWRRDMDARCRFWVLVAAVFVTGSMAVGQVLIAALEAWV